ncbi:alpha/beta fold hydrolase [Deinococcus navajonensis]|uniref:Alpha/beta fold hydrolase n=1 Tax=Deinococcus navajonensis TaxID=309884 RepID=A0ABV8XRF2_9DEIO
MTSSTASATRSCADDAVPEATGRYLAKNLPNADLAYLPGVGHVPNFTEPETFHQGVAHFLESEVMRLREPHVAPWS